MLQYFMLNFQTYQRIPAAANKRYIREKEEKDGSNDSSSDRRQYRVIKGLSL